MTRYFEIGGHVVECSTAPQSSLSVSRISMMHSRKAVDSRIVGGDARPSPRTAKDSLAEHWFKVVSYPVRSLGPEIGLDILSGPKKLGPATPYIWAAKGLGVYFKVVEMNYDYFVKGESHDW